jgi:hypothetical protein
MTGYDIFAWIVLIILIASVIAVFCIAGWLPRRTLALPARSRPRNILIRVSISRPSSAGR